MLTAALRASLCSSGYNQITSDAIQKIRLTGSLPLRASVNTGFIQLRQRQGFMTARVGSEGCSKDTPILSVETLKTKLEELPLWRLKDDNRKIVLAFVAKNFLAAIDFFQRVSSLAEEMNHHPDLHLTNYREVEIDLSTHAIGGVSEVDIALAKKIDALPVEYSPKWWKQQQEKAGNAN